MNQQNIDIFNDTLDFIKNNDTLNKSIFDSIKNTILYKNKVLVENKKTKNNLFYVSKNKSFEAAIELNKKYPNKRIAVLNFASATNPGGGVKTGSSAQEESLCRCSTLYRVLTNKYLFDNYYSVNRRRQNPLHDDSVIYTPNIIICKTDDGFYTRLNENSFVKIDVISAAAPNLRERPTNCYNLDGFESVNVSNEDLYNIHLSRGKQILEVAIKNDIDILVLGAFGCGAFRNNPTIVARAYKNLLKDYSKYFDVIEFAVYCNKYDTENYNCFKEIIGGNYGY